MNPAILPETAVLFMLAFARVGALMMLLPGLGERAVPARLRLALAVMLAVMALPLVREGAGGPGGARAQWLVSELLLGLALGVGGRLILAAMETAGSLIAQSIGLSFAQSVDPSQGGQGEVVATFLRMFGVTAIFAADLHHVAIAGIFGSYAHLPVGAALPVGDLAELMLRLTEATFRAAFAIAAPFIVFGFVFNLGLGLSAKLVPQIQLFFLATPLAAALGVALLALTLSAIALRFTGMTAETLALILPIGR